MPLTTYSGAFSGFLLIVVLQETTFVVSWGTASENPLAAVSTERCFCVIVIIKYIEDWTFCPKVLTLLSAVVGNLAKFKKKPKTKDLALKNEKNFNSSLI